jgi:hypothetical protein
LIKRGCGGDLFDVVEVTGRSGARSLIDSEAAGYT